MKMKEAVRRLAVEFGPEDKNPNHLVDKIVKIMPNKEVPDHVLKTVHAVGVALKKAGVK